ncbi:MAG TPA: formate dehydrogenase accessory protein FdhE [Gemmatimonadales bacterium]|nr:formate dehydrogenase accessory protein FdhE [Gemmatimonadales bacterium]
MLWPLTQRRHVANPQLAHRIAEVRRESPESERWLALVEAAFAEAGSGEAWADAVLTISADQPAPAPILHGARIGVRRRALHRWTRELLGVAGLEPARGRLESADLLEAAVEQSDERLDDIARTVELDAPALRVAAQQLALPLLQTCGRALSMQVPPATAWQEGYCPVCGAWPTLAEFRGLERKRWLRCGRCATGWEVAWLRCPFCNETEHTNLGSLAPEAGETTRKVEVCDSCKGYVKAEPTVRSLAPWDIVLDDLATVPLEVAALDRGYHRPDRPGYSLKVRVVET